MRCLIVLFLIFVSVYVFAADNKYNIGEVVITADRFDEPVNEVGSSVSIINDDDIQEMGSITVADVLHTVPGINVVRNGGLGGYTSVFIRGAESYHTLVMIDGIEMNDPISATRTFDWANLLTDDIEKIEIVRGAQSTLYGSDAIGGVINIITKKGKGKPVVGVTFEGGSYYTYKGSAYSAGSFKNGDYSVSLTRVGSSGFSMAEYGKEDDGYQNTTFMGKFNINLSEKIKYFFTWRYLDANNELDDGAFDDDPNYNSHTVNFSGKTGVLHNIKDWWKYDLNFSWLETKNNYWDPTDSIEPFDYTKSWYDGMTLKGSWQNTVDIYDFSTLIAGIEYQEEQGESFSIMQSSFGEFISEFPKKAIDTLGIYIQDTIKIFERLIFTLGARYEDHDMFGSNWDYRATVNYALPKWMTIIKGSIGTGFKAPSLFQLYSIYGNTNLEAEKVESFDIGFEQPLFDNRIIPSVTYFYNDFSNLIDWDDSLWVYRNISKANTSGVETELNWIICEKLNAGIMYTYLHTEDKSTGKQLDRRPMHTSALTLSFYPTEKYTIRMDVSYVGKRKDVNYAVFPYEQITLDGYTKVDISMQYRINANCTFFGRVENLFDKKYQEVYGFNTPRISGYGGLKIEF